MADMKLWKISQSENVGYDTYDSAVVAAPTEEAARRTNPGGYCIWSDEKGYWVGLPDNEPAGDCGWAQHIDQVTVELLGTCAEGIEAGVICTSFNAG